jgi:serine/threonine protein kinase
MPEKFGRYVLIDRVGSGGMADVFRAVTFGWEGFRRIIVVKRLRHELSESPDFLRMFFDEAKISALLHHPNIVQVYDFGQVKGYHFLAMEYLEGKDVASILRSLRAAKRTLEPSLAAHIGREVARGLHYAHKLRGPDGQPFDIVHRDINPANVMLLRTGGVKVLDFGIAKASEAAGKSQTQRAIVKGKLSYLSPEQAACEPLNGRSDIFSWGATMWEMLTGARLFGGKTDFDRLTAVKQALVPPPSMRRPGIARELDRIVLRALERDLARRYQSAEELAGDLDRFLLAAPPEPDAVTRLLSDLYGDESSSVMVMPPLDHLTAVANGLEESGPQKSYGNGNGDGDSADDSEPSQLRTVSAVPPRREIPHELAQEITIDTSGFGPADRDGSAEGQAGSRRTVIGWTAGAALMIAAVAAIWWSLRGGPLAAPPPMGGPAAAVGSVQPTSNAPAVVKIEVDSDPPGAQVSGSGGPLGTTPLTVSLPASIESEQLRFEKPGFSPILYEVRPKSAGIVFVELKPAPR